MRRYETKAEQMGYRQVAGVDEAGRGPLAGPVVAAAVVLPSSARLDGLTDSKKLSAAMRDAFFARIQEEALGIGIGIVEHDVIDEINILQASRLVMKHAVEKLPQPPDLLLIDGIHTIDRAEEQWTLVEGDQKSQSIAAASVLAKVTRDRLMQAYHKRYPEYGFDRHKGYPTASHKEQIRRHGACPIHRKTFRGVKT
ncbi:MAG: ribonuclease HII [Nitrospinaceae bacterium]|nr:MAG: ribonuclease HII [Nitrospinaceae bacterium]